MQTAEQKSFHRQVAYKVKISEILNSNLVKDDLSAGYIKLNDVDVSRVNVVGTVVYKSEQDTSYSNSVIDDGTGRITLRSFENKNVFSKIDVGDGVLVIGKIREFNNERYIIPEIIKKMNNIIWLNVRRLELLGNRIIDDKIKSVDNGATEELNSISEEIYSLIKKLDEGDGVSVGDIILNSNSSKAETIITKLLENGDVFEIKPGKLKILE